MKRIATGTMAGGGTALRNSRSGPTARLSRGDTPMSSPTPAPIVTATAKPSSRVNVVADNAGYSRPLFASNTRPFHQSEGGGKYGEFPVCKSCQTGGRATRGNKHRRDGSGANV